MAKDPSAQSAFISASLGGDQVRIARAPESPTLGSLPDFDPTMVHYRWTLDSPVQGEPMKFAASRYLARVLGTILVSTTTGDAQAEATFERVLGDKPRVENYVQFLNATVEVLDSKVAGLTDATNKVYAAFEKALAPQSITSEEGLGLIASVSEQSCRRMLDELLQPPRSGRGVSRIGQEDLDCMSTVFGERGNVEKIEISLRRGRLSSVLCRALVEADREYRVLESAMLARAIPESIINCAARVELHELHDTESAHSSFKITPQGFRDAYIKAGFDYVLTYAKDLRAKASKMR